MSRRTRSSSNEESYQHFAHAAVYRYAIEFIVYGIYFYTYHRDHLEVSPEFVPLYSHLAGGALLVVHNSVIK